MHERFDGLHGVVALGVTVTHLEEVGKVQPTVNHAGHSEH